jgi:hypothetical protein
MMAIEVWRRREFREVSYQERFYSDMLLSLLTAAWEEIQVWDISLVMLSNIKVLVVLVFCIACSKCIAK